MVDERRVSGTIETAASWDRGRAEIASRGGVPATVICTCPYLVGRDGWRSIAVSKEHRCVAIDPPGSVGADRQKRLCLAAGHLECSTFRASEELRAIARPRDASGAVPVRPIVQTIPVLLDRRRGGTFASLLIQRRTAQMGLVGLMSVALAAFVYARGIVPAAESVPAGTGRPAGPIPSIPVAAATPSIGGGSPVATVLPGSPSPTGSPSPSSTPGAAETPSAVSPTPSTSPSPAATPSPARTYTVRAGDTLVSIAARFGTSALALRTLNNISDPRALRVGQVLTLP